MFWSIKGVRRDMMDLQLGPRDSPMKSDEINVKRDKDSV